MGAYMSVGKISRQVRQNIIRRAVKAGLEPFGAGVKYGRFLENTRIIQAAAKLKYLEQKDG